MAVIIDGSTGISPVTASGTSASIDGMTVGRGGGEVSTATVVGSGALAATNTGAYNAAFGLNALNANTSGTNNQAFGAYALYLNTTGSNNKAFGDSALQSNTTGGSNVAVGQAALTANTTASNNTAVGYQAGYATTTSAYNTFLGYQSGVASTSSFATFVGTFAGYNTTGTINTFVGYGAGGSVTSGAKNTIIGGYNGNQVGVDIRTSSNNIVVSDGDGNPRIWITSTGNTIFNGAGIPNGTVYGGSAFQSAGDGRMQLIQATTTSGTRALQEFYNSNGNVGSLGTTGTSTYYATSSDYRLKENVAPMTGALNKVALLKPCTYTWKNSQEDSQGFIAHELAEVCPDAVIGEKDAVKEDGTPQYQSIDTSFLVATLTAAIQELKAEVDALKAAK